LHAPVSTHQLDHHWRLQRARARVCVCVCREREREEGYAQVATVEDTVLNRCVGQRPCCRCPPVTCRNVTCTTVTTSKQADQRLIVTSRRKIVSDMGTAKSGTLRPKRVSLHIGPAGERARPPVQSFFVADQMNRTGASGGGRLGDCQSIRRERE
jgi:hypothetical protein